VNGEHDILGIHYHYDANCDWYIRRETYEVDGVKHMRGQHMHYYNGKSNIPKVSRKKEESKNVNRFNFRRITGFRSKP
jgi:hypothetical protein